MRPATYLFGEFRIDPQARELHVNGLLLALSPRVFDCIVYLLEHRDRAVGRDELISAVWGRVDVSDTLLGQTILKARRALGDGGRTQEVIRTVPRFGYRWVAAVAPEVAPEPTAEVAEPALEPLPPPSRRPAAESPGASTPTATARTAAPRVRTHALWLAVALLLLAAVAILFWLQRSLPQPQGPALPATSQPAPQTGEDAIAVLPFAVTAGEDWTWLRLVLMDLVAARLRDAGLGVVPSDTIVALLRSHSDAEVGSLSGARDLLRTAVARTADGWRVQLDLFDPSGQTHRSEAHAAEPTSAAAAAADRLLGLLGHAATGRDTRLPQSAEALLSRSEAALLTDDLVGARRLLEDAPASLKALPALGLRMAQIEYRAGQLQAARQRLEALLSQVGAETDPVLRARLLNGLGAVAVREDHPAEAERAFAAAVALLETRRQPAALGQAWTGLAVAQAAQGRYDEAAAGFAKARVALKLAGDSLALARVEENEAVDAAKRSRFAEAASGHENAARQFERLGALNELAAALGNLADAQLELLQPADALATTVRASETLGRLENRGTRVEVELQRIAALLANGHTSAAATLLSEVRPTAATSGDDASVARLQLEQARLDLAAEAYGPAASGARQAVVGLQSADYRRERANAWLLLLRALRGQGAVAEARTEAALMRAWAASSDWPPLPTYTALVDAEEAWSRGDFAAATAAWRQALDRAREVEVPSDTATVAISWARRLIASGELDQASALVGLAARWSANDYDCALLQLRYYHALGEPATWRQALEQARLLAGERTLPAELLQAPEGRTPPGAIDAVPASD